MTTIDTILFDLDGTLLPIEMDYFIKVYFKKLSERFDHILNPEDFIKYVWDSTKHVMFNKEPDRTNESVFMQHFENSIKQDINEFIPIFNDFYKNDFKELKYVADKQPIVPRIIEELKKKSYNMVIATSPIFPCEAIIERMKWAGLNEQDFMLITTYEIMHFCKPHIEYYAEILELIQKTPKQCMMIGNDAEEDLVASKLGIKTFYLTDYAINKKKVQIFADYTGDYEDLYDLVKELPKLKRN